MGSVAFDVEQFRIGLEVEFEHGTRDLETNVTDDNLTVTAKIGAPERSSRLPTPGDLALVQTRRHGWRRGPQSYALSAPRGRFAAASVRPWNAT